MASLGHNPDLPSKVNGAIKSPEAAFVTFCTNDIAWSEGVLLSWAVGGVMMGGIFDRPRLRNREECS